MANTTDAADSGGTKHGAIERGSAADWDGVRRTYCGSDLTVAQICTVFAVSRGQFYRRRREENWPLRSQSRNPASSDPVSPVEPESVCAATTSVPRALPKTAAGLRTWRKGMITRLYAAMDRQLAEIERQQSEQSGMTGAERERQTRQMNVMTRSMEKLAEFHDQETRRNEDSKAAAGQKSGKASRDPETWRHEIARRITRIRERWLAEEAARDG